MRVSASGKGDGGGNKQVADEPPVGWQAGLYTISRRSHNEATKSRCALATGAGHSEPQYAIYTCFFTVAMNPEKRMRILRTAARPTTVFTYAWISTIFQEVRIGGE